MITSNLFCHSGSVCPGSIGLSHTIAAADKLCSTLNGAKKIHDIKDHYLLSVGKTEEDSKQDWWNPTDIRNMKSIFSKTYSLVLKPSFPLALSRNLDKTGIHSTMEQKVSLKTIEQKVSSKNHGTKIVFHSSRGFMKQRIILQLQGANVTISLLESIFKLSSKIFSFPLHLWCNRRIWNHLKSPQQLIKLYHTVNSKWYNKKDTLHYFEWWLKNTHFWGVGVGLWTTLPIFKMNDGKVQQ